jgi:hypothetical protein
VKCRGQRITVRGILGAHRLVLRGAVSIVAKHSSSSHAPSSGKCCALLSVMGYHGGIVDLITSTIYTAYEVCLETKPSQAWPQECRSRNIALVHSVYTGSRIYSSVVKPSIWLSMGHSLGCRRTIMRDVDIQMRPRRRGFFECRFT